MADSVLKRGWSTRRFDQMATMVNDRVDDPSLAGVDYYVGLEHLDSDSLAIRRWGSPSDVEATKLRFRPGDIIFGRRRVYQRKLGVAHFDGICSAHAMVLRAKPSVVLPEFLPFFMQSDLFMERAKEISVGSLSPTINWKTLAQEEFKLPPLEEQRKIIAVLSLLEGFVESLRTVIQCLRAVHRTYLVGLSQSGDSQLVSLGSLLTSITAGKSVVGADIAPVAAEKGVLKVSAVDPRGFLPDESKRLLNQAEFVDRLSLRAGDVLISRANTAELVGEVCRVDQDYPNLMLCDKTLRLDPALGVDGELLAELLQAEHVRQQLRRVATGTGRAMKNISQPAIRLLEVDYPRDSLAREEARMALHSMRKAEMRVRARYDESVAQAATLRNSLLNGAPR